jgi:hypothetical protein
MRLTVMARREEEGGDDDREQRHTPIEDGRDCGIDRLLGRRDQRNGTAMFTTDITSRWP